MRNIPVQQTEAETYLKSFECEIQEVERDLLGSSDSENIVQEILKRATAFYQADRAYIIEADWELWVGTNTYEWCAEGIPTQKENRKSMDLEQLPQWRGSFTSKAPIVIDNVESIRSSEPQEYAHLKQYDITALLAVPLHKKMSGYLCVDNPKRFKQHSSLLRSFSYVAAAELTELKLLKTARLKHGSQLSENEIVLNFFGGLEVITSMGQMSEEDIKSALCCRLITYLYLNRKRTIATRDLADYLWSDHLLDNPNAAVKRLVYRCRKTLSYITQTPVIVFGSSGGYELNRNLTVTSDVEQLEQLCAKTREEPAMPEKAEIYQKAISLYKGTFLPKHNDDLWLMPKASYYHIMFLDMVKRCLLELYELGMHAEVYRLVDYALPYESNDHELNFYLVDSLFRMRAIEAAQQHYFSTRDLYSPEQEYKLKQLFGFST